MHFAIIAAGEGSRLREDGITLPKPLVPIAGIPMVDRLMLQMIRCGAEDISIICNCEMREVVAHLDCFRQQHPEVPIHVTVKQTPSSMHSLGCLMERLPAGKVCVTTIDTLCCDFDLHRFVHAFDASSNGLFVVTPWVDDEKPLWVDVGEEEAILGFYDRQEELPTEHPALVSGGIYGFDTHTAWPVLRQCLAEGQHRMRNFQRALIRAGVGLKAFRIERVMDIDHAEDLRKANEWLKPRRVLAIRRAPEYSPNNIDKDAAILQAVTDRYVGAGDEVTVVDEDEFAQIGIDECRSYDLILLMARRVSTLRRLSQLDVPMLNWPQSVLKVSKSRELTFTMLQQAGIALAPWWAYDPEEDEMFQCEPPLQQLLPGWVKAMRSDGVLPQDVALVKTPLEADCHVIELAEQRVPDIVVTRHLEGDLIKTYVVMPRGGDPTKDPFVRTFYPQEHAYSKYGTSEQHNTPLARIPYNNEQLQQMASVIAETLDLQVFGFDAIVQPDGSIVVIDVNDWPSYSFCREEAADAIFAIYDRS